MKLLEEKILQDGIIKPGGVLIVNNFLNHQMDIGLFNEMGKEWGRLFKEDKVNKILTIEASGIGLAVIAAQYFNNCPVVFAKKAASKNLGDQVYTAEVFSFTKGAAVNVKVDKKFLSSDDRVLIIDDFLANGAALSGLIQICDEAGAKVVGAGIAIEKEFQGGGNKIREAGYKVESLAKIKEFKDDTIVF